MTKTQFKNWVGVVISAVVLGLAVTFLMKAWQPQDTLDWVLWVVGLLIAFRSVFRIATLAKVIGSKEATEE